MSGAPTRRALLVAGDIAAFVAFGLVGLASHDDALTQTTFARAILPFPVAWLLIAPFFGAFSARAAEGRYPVANVLMIWAAAGIFAMAGRALVFDRELFTAFFAIGITGAGLFLAGWRAVYNWWANRSDRRPEEVPAHGKRT
ncbi:MAG: DUF3054 domain-containing protein [Chloroflexi bacterium]|nr:DUF3054 domain-containing protein [Chloroflexota bacterium]